jgi:hypothetical protein
VAGASGSRQCASAQRPRFLPQESDADAGAQQGLHLVAAGADADAAHADLLAVG